MSTENQPLPVKGYTGQSNENVALANELKEAEERYLRCLDMLDALPTAAKSADGRVAVGIDDEEIAALKEIIPIVSRLNAAQAENVLTFLLNKSQRELKARSIYGAQLLGLERK